MEQYLSQIHTWQQVAVIFIVVAAPLIAFIIWIREINK